LFKHKSNSKANLVIIFRAKSKRDKASKFANASMRFLIREIHVDTNRPIVIYISLEDNSMLCLISDIRFNA